MLVEILLALLVVAVILLMAVDLARAPSELPQGPAPDAGQDLVRAPGPIGTGAFRREAAGAGTATAAPDAGRPGQRPGADVTAPPAVTRPPSHPGRVPAGGSGGGLRNWPIRSRLLLLVAIPTVTAVAFGIILIVSSLRRPSFNPVTGVASGGPVMSAPVAGAVVVIVLALAVLLTIVVARSMIQPLSRLQAGALRVTRLLPAEVGRINEDEDVRLDVEPIGVDSADEIGVVARAFDEVHGEALRLAANEAALRRNVNAMFVNLSRRSQSLVERQIRFIDDLEQGEQDAERLSNLFKMDHLATRMRRNSENLLVLAGQEPLSRGNQPVALVDVIRAALSEIEEYERVTLNVQPGIMVTGPAASDVVHTIAELAENATSLSAADTVVKISGHLLTSGGVLIDVTDEGVGMREREMQQANWQLENPPVVDVAISRRMGLFVVGRLARRHGIRVRLRPATSGGVTALVWLPEDLITHEDMGAPPGPAGPRVVGASGPGRAAWMDTGRAAAEQAATSAGMPRFAPLREGDHDAPPGLRRIPGAGLPAPEGAPAPRASRGDEHAGDPGRPAAGPGFPVRPERPGRGRDAADPAARTDSPAASGLTGRALGTGPVPGSGPSVADAKREVPPAGAPLTAPAPVSREARPARGTASALAGGSPAEDQRLPVFEAVESDWFRRGRLPGPVGPAAAASTGWTSPADEGWQAAQVVAVPSSNGVTTSGLPKRVPQANLVPGTAASGQPSAQPGSPPRSAAATRDRFASFQRGVTEGRAAVGPPGPEGEEETS
jgi:HAMP domain